MKTLFTLLVTVLLFSNCSAQKTDSIMIEYKAQTRGSSISLITNSNQIIYASTDKNLELKLSKHQWDEIVKFVLNIDLDNIKNLIRPSTESYTDRALSASMSITKNGTLYESSTFDHGNPPSELKNLINKLFEIVNLD